MSKEQNKKLPDGEHCPAVEFCPVYKLEGIAFCNNHNCVFMICPQTLEIQITTREKEYSVNLLRAAENV
jgi:hypothetical protein